MMVFFPPVLFGTPLICTLFMPHFVAKSQRVCFTTVFVVVSFCCYYYWWFFICLFIYCCSILGWLPKGVALLLSWFWLLYNCPWWWRSWLGGGFMALFSAGQCRQPVVVVVWDVVVFLFPPQHDHLLDMFGNMTQINLIRFKTAQHT